MLDKRSLFGAVVAASGLLASATLVAGPLDTYSTGNERVVTGSGNGLSWEAQSMTGNERVVTGSSNGLNWEAQSMIVGFNPTAGGGQDPRYHATGGEYNGVVALIMDFGGSLFICSGSLLPDRRSILTAAHCVTDGSLGTPDRTTAYFYNGSDPDYRVPFGAESIAIDVSNYFIASGYTGEVIDQNDLAVLRLEAFAPEFANSYDLYLGDLTGQDFNVAGYGARSTIGGNGGANAQTGFLRQGDNRFEWYLDDPDFLGFWDGFFGDDAEYGRVVLSDFDNGLAANDAGCLVAFAILGGAAATPKFCDLGLGEDEVSVAGGDSGGPQFIDWMIASVTSFGLSFGTAFGDILPGLQSSFGEFAGYVPVSVHADFIRSVMFTASVPEPGTLLLLGSALFVVGYRRRRLAA